MKKSSGVQTVVNVIPYNHSDTGGGLELEGEYFRQLRELAIVSIYIKQYIR